MNTYVFVDTNSRTAENVSTVVVRAYSVDKAWKTLAHYLRKVWTFLDSDVTTTELEETIKNQFELADIIGETDSHEYEQ